MLDRIIQWFVREVAYTDQMHAEAEASLMAAYRQPAPGEGITR